MRTIQPQGVKGSELVICSTGNSYWVQGDLQNTTFTVTMMISLGEGGGIMSIDVERRYREWVGNGSHHRLKGGELNCRS